jgi:hypothetical protein
MTWNISSFVWTDNNNRLTIKGFRNNNTPIKMVTTIVKTNIFTAFANQRRYHEGTSLSVISPEDVYVIDSLMDSDPDGVKEMRNNSYVSAEELFFNEIPYMGLPLLVFSNWKGLINTDI